MLTTTETRLLRVLIALRDATGAKTRTPVPESGVADLLGDDAGLAGSVPDQLDDLERQGFAQIAQNLTGIRDVQMTAHGKIKAEEFDRMQARARGSAPSTPAATHRPVDAARVSVDAARLDPEQARSTPAENWRAQVEETLDAVTQAIALLPPDTTVVVRSLIEDARKALSADSRGRARRALTALGGFLGDAASGALGNVLAAQMLALVPQLRN